MSGKPWPESLDLPKRRKLAAKRTNLIIDLLIFLGGMREANEIVLYSDVLSRQFPERSRAANAFNTFRHSMAMFEIMRLAAVWDPPSKDKISIPTVARIVSSPKFIKHAAKHAAALAAAWPPASADEIKADPSLPVWIAARSAQAADERQAEVRTLLTEACELCERTLTSNAMKSLKHARDNYLAHHLDVGDEDQEAPAGVHSFHDNDKQNLLSAAREVTHKLHLALSGGGFDWAGSQAIAKRNAEELWTSCRFEIPGR